MIAVHFQAAVFFLAIPALAMAATPAQSPDIPVPEMVYIEGGEFEMGTLAGFSETPIKRVRLHSFHISKYEITFEQFDAFTTATGRKKLHDLGWGRGKRPAVGISGLEAVEYADWLSLVTGKNYRLPTEAEWEFAARAGSRVGQYSWGDEAGEGNANCRECGSQWGGEMTAPVGSFAPNAYGLHDMHGNVWEWVGECYSSTGRDFTLEDARRCDLAYVRGGSWDSSADDMRVWNRSVHRRGSANNDVGIRLVMDVE